MGRVDTTWSTMQMSKPTKGSPRPRRTMALGLNSMRVGAKIGMTIGRAREDHDTSLLVPWPFMPKPDLERHV
jgi:hypothetical protein